MYHIHLCNTVIRLTRIGKVNNSMNMISNTIVGYVLTNVLCRFIFFKVCFVCLLKLDLNLQKVLPLCIIDK